MRGAELARYAQTHGLVALHIAELIQHLRSARREHAAEAGGMARAA